MSVAFGLLTNETYLLDNAQARRPPAQYLCAIMQYGIRCNIVDIANQLSFAYRGIAPELRVFVSPPIELKKAVDFIRALEEKQKVWHEMMTALLGPQQYYNPARRPSSYRLPLPDQSEAFFCYQSQHRIPQLQQPWQPSNRPFKQVSELGQPAPPAGPQHQYTSQPFCQ